MIVCALLPAGGVLSAQSKKLLTQDTYDFWRQIQGASLSPDGRWAIYTLTPVVGDGEVVVRATEGATEYRATRGWTGRPINSVTVDSPFVTPPAQITADSRYAVFIGYATKAEFDRARSDKRPASQQPRNSLAILSLADGQITTIQRVKSFRLARESGRYVVHQLEPDMPGRDSASRSATPDTMARAGGGGDAGPRKREYGSVLVIRDLSDGSETRVDDVSDTRSMTARATSSMA